jgi:hypothetical protein
MVIEFQLAIVRERRMNQFFSYSEISGFWLLNDMCFMPSGEK